MGRKIEKRTEKNEEERKMQERTCQLKECLFFLYIYKNTYLSHIHKKGQKQLSSINNVQKKTKN